MTQKKMKSEKCFNMKKNEVEIQRATRLLGQKSLNGREFRIPSFYGISLRITEINIFNFYCVAIQKCHRPAEKIDEIFNDDKLRSVSCLNEEKEHILSKSSAAKMASQRTSFIIGWKAKKILFLYQKSNMIS